MEERELEFKSYKKQIEDIIRAGRDINFSSIKSDIEITIEFFLTYYSSGKYSARFTDNERHEIENYSYKPFADAVTQILARKDWQNTEHERYRSNIRNAYRQLLERGYITRVEAAKGADSHSLDEALQHFEAKSSELLAEQKASLEAAQSAASQAFESLETQRTAIDRKIKQIDTKAEKASKSLARQISSTSGEAFLKESIQYGGSAKKWLATLIIVVIAASILLTWLLIDVAAHPKDFNANLVFSGVKVSAIIILIYLIQIAMRNYNTNKHLETINRQRATVISFVNTFVSSVDGDQYKDYLLTYAAKTVFDHGETGFISRNYGAGTSSDDGLDIILSSIPKLKQ